MSTTEARGPLFGAAELPAAWHISSRSEKGGMSCVEAGPLNDGSGRVAVRHSHYPHADAIVYNDEEWNTFLAGIKTGDFDFTS